jgi:hypothetical protein
LDEVIPEHTNFDFLTLDIQGAELEALKGMGRLISKVRWIFTEVNRREMYSGIPLVSDLDTFLSERGFSRVVTLWNPAGWGDALYVRTSGNLLESFSLGIASVAAVALFRIRESYLRSKKRLIKFRRRVFRLIDRVRGLS